MANFIIAPPRLKLAPGDPLPEFVNLRLIASELTPLAGYYITLNGHLLWAVDTDGQGRFNIERSFYPRRDGDFQFEVSKIENARQGIDAEANRAFRIEYVEPKPSRWEALKAQARKQLARLIARGDA